MGMAADEVREKPGPGLVGLLGCGRLLWRSEVIWPLSHTSQAACLSSLPGWTVLQERTIHSWAWQLHILYVHFNSDVKSKASATLMLWLTVIPG